MGNKALCKDIGIKPDTTIGTSEFNELWLKCSKNTNYLSAKKAKVFLKDFAKTANVEYSRDLAEYLINKCDKGKKGRLDKKSFEHLFFLRGKGC